MARPSRRVFWMPALLATLFLSACGGGDDGAPSTTVTSPAPLQEAGGPVATGDTATDSINWFNFRRQQIGLPATVRNARIDAAAFGHSNYQRLNGITHDQEEGRPGFTGESPYNRLIAAGYQFTSTQNSYVGEVIVRTGNVSGFNASEDLIAAIYHRLVIFEPVFKEIGAGAATASNGSVYVTTNFAVNGVQPVLGIGSTVVYPFDRQQRIPTSFFSDTEEPDPVPNRNEVGFPISIHADITSRVTVQSFTVRPNGGSPLSVRLLDPTTDPNLFDRRSADGRNTPFISGASIVPLDPLTRGTTYDVRFAGTVDGVPVNRAWSFTTQ